MRRPSTLLLMFLVSGCSHVPLTSLPKLNRLDMMTLDASQLRFAADMPVGLRVRRDSAVIEAGLKERFVLEEITPEEAGGNLTKCAQAFHLSTVDLRRLEALRAMVRERKQNFLRDTHGYLTVTSSGCRIGPLPDGALHVDTMLKTADREDFFVLTNDVDLRA